ncbi:MAG: hypothetical protein DMD89_32950 [Candidatus Rokuibacteriota bacterium]|nr:MAG: hypothetical protein DMD89_32950 [Candidatus Rokubacteria bacterium]
MIIRPVALAGLLLAGCTVAPTGPSINVPDVGGMWAGTWGGTPVTLLVTDQRDDVPSGAGVYVGSWLLLGGQTPGLSGVMSYTARGDHVSVNVNGRFAMLEGRLALIVDSAAPDGAQQLRLKWIEPDQLVGCSDPHTARARQAAHRRIDRSVGGCLRLVGTSRGSRSVLAKAITQQLADGTSGRSGNRPA